MQFASLIDSVEIAALIENGCFEHLQNDMVYWQTSTFANLMLVDLAI